MLFDKLITFCQLKSDKSDNMEIIKTLITYNEKDILKSGDLKIYIKPFLEKVKN